MPGFQYSPVLPLEIRLLELQAGVFGDPLVGTIVHQVLSVEDDKIPDFEALSYCWGDQSHPEPITLTNEQPANEEQSAQEPETGFVKIGPNLASALRSLRYSSEKRIVWCDSICINQKDLAERSLQVQRMSDIFRHARSVIVWLGPETSWSVVAMKTLRWLGRQVKSVTYSHSTGGYVYDLVDTADDRFEEVDRTHPLSFAEWRAFEQLLALDWHTRLWTYQEIVLANQTTCVIWLGREAMPWTLFKNIVIFGTFKLPPRHAILDPVGYSGNAMQFMGRAIACDTFEHYDMWLPAIRMAMHHQCSDSRDKVFALQGLMDPDVARSITPDYTKSPKELFTSFCLEHLSRYNNLEFLGFCNANTSPTWVADLEGPMRYLPVIGHAARFSVAHAYLDEPGVLNVAGIWCDELCEDPVKVPDWQPLQSLEEYRQVMVEAIRALSDNGSVDDDDYLDKIIMALLYEYVRDYNIQKLKPPKTTASLRSLEDWRKRIREWLNGVFTEKGDAENLWQSDSAYMSSRPRIQATTDCSRTRNGSFVRVPSAGRRGDIVAVFLGSGNPILLRPQEGFRAFSVIGPCYHSGFSESQALLGDDFKGWGRLWDEINQSLIFYQRGLDIRIEDPRLDNVPLPEGFGADVSQEDGMPFIYQMISGSRVMVYDDPRLSEAELKKRGVPVERFRLV
jgi:hypothetical protein